MTTEYIFGDIHEKIKDIKSLDQKIIARQKEVDIREAQLVTLEKKQEKFFADQKKSQD